MEVEADTGSWIGVLDICSANEAVGIFADLSPVSTKARVRLDCRRSQQQFHLDRKVAVAICFFLLS